MKRSLAAQLGQFSYKNQHICMLLIEAATANPAGESRTPCFQLQWPAVALLNAGWMNHGFKIQTGRIGRTPGDGPAAAEDDIRLELRRAAAPPWHF